jgi:hypothetical protein
MTEATVPAPAADEALVEPRVRELLNRYVALSGAGLAEMAPQLYQLTVPTADVGAFAGRSSIRIAFTLEALQSDPKSEMAIIGSAFVNQLIEAARLRGSRLSAGLISGADADATGKPVQPVPVRDCSVAEPVARFVRHRVGRLIARVVIRAGSAIDEQLVESALHDLSTGAPVGQDLAALCVVPTSTAIDVPVQSDPWKWVPEAEVRPVRELVTWMLGSLERQTKPRIEAIAESRGSGTEGRAWAARPVLRGTRGGSGWPRRPGA